MLNDTETVLPGGTLTPGQIHKLKIAIAIMSVLLVVGFILLLVGIYVQSQKLTKKPEAASPLTIAAGATAVITLPVKPGTEIRQILADQGRLILHLSYAGGAEIAVIDLATGREVQRIRLAPQESP